MLGVTARGGGEVEVYRHGESLVAAQWIFYFTRLNMPAKASAHTACGPAKSCGGETRNIVTTSAELCPRPLRPGCGPDGSNPVVLTFTVLRGPTNETA